MQLSRLLRRRARREGDDSLRTRACRDARPGGGRRSEARIGDDLEGSMADDFDDAPDDFTPYT